MGKYDDLLADLPSAQTNTSPGGGRFDDLLNDLPVAEPSLMDRAKSVYAAMQPGFKAAKILTGIVTPGSGIPELAQEFAPKIAQKEGEMIAEKGGEMGYPKTAAAIGTGVSMIPEIATAITGFKGMGESDIPLIKGLMNTPEELSPEYDILHKAAGISKDLPIQRGNALRFPNMAGQPSSIPPPFAPAISPLSYAKDPNTLLNLARGRMEALADKLSPQELNDYKTLIGQMIDTGKIGAGKPLAIATQLKAQATELLNNRVQGLADLNKAYAIAKTMKNPMQLLPDFIQTGIQKYGPWFARAAAVAGGIRSVSGH